MTLREQLSEMADPGYRNFIMPLMPGVNDVVGVRLPQLRRLAREIARGDDRQAYLGKEDGGCFEERMLRGMVIGYMRCTPVEKLEHVARFVPQIDNWAVCDSFCWTLRREERAPMWQFIQPYFRSPSEYDVRFAAVMALRNSSTKSISKTCWRSSTASVTRATTPAWRWRGPCRWRSSGFPNGPWSGSAHAGWTTGLSTNRCRRSSSRCA